jgi:DNA-binding NarL/FixJ family response regulator
MIETGETAHGSPGRDTAVSRAEAWPRVLIISDVRLYREGLALSLARGGALEVVGATSSADAIESTETLCPDAVLLDGSLPNGLALSRAILRGAPSTRIVGFGIDGDEHGVLACAEAGLSAFVWREGTTAELAAAVGHAMRGELPCSPRIAGMLFNRLGCLAGDRDPARGEPSLLTRREQQIAELIAQGLSNKEVAIQLRIGAATVKNHVHNILEKLKIKRRAAITAYLRG